MVQWWDIAIFDLWWLMLRTSLLSWRFLSLQLNAGSWIICQHSFVGHIICSGAGKGRLLMIDLMHWYSNPAIYIKALCRCFDWEWVLQRRRWRDRPKQETQLPRSAIVSLTTSSIIQCVANKKEFQSGLVACWLLNSSDTSCNIRGCLQEAVRLGLVHQSREREAYFGGAYV